MNRHPSDGETRGARSGETALDEKDPLIQTPEDHEDYGAFSGDADASPDDRRRDPLRQNWR